MKAERAPVYVAALDLCHWLLAHSEGWSEGHLSSLQGRAQRHALDGVEAVSLALRFRRDRRERLHRANAAMDGLRLAVRLGEPRGLFSASQARHIHRLIDDVGRMVGAWEKAEARGRFRPQERPSGAPGEGGEA